MRDDVDGWLSSWRAGRPAEKRWGAIEDQLMLSALADYDGNIDGRIGSRSQEAVRRFQGAEGMGESGKLDDATRRALVTKYLQQDGTTLPDGTKLVLHGAGAHHPVAEEKRRNRRVEIFLSEGPIAPAPGAPDGPEYDEWIKKASETVDFTDAPEDLVEIDLEWPADVIARLPEDFTLRLSGPDVAPQERKRSAGVKDGGRVRFEFRILDKATRVDLEASGGEKTVELWSDQAIGDLESNVEWAGNIDALFVIAQGNVVDLVTVGKTGRLYVIKDTDDTKSQAVYVQEDEKVFKIMRDGARKWTVKGAEL